MKYFLTFLLFSSIISCKSVKLHHDNKDKPVQSITINQDACPEGMDCSVELLKNKAISYQTEASTGKLYPVFVMDSASRVLKFTFTKAVQDKQVMDAGYKEEIIFEWPKSKSELNLQDVNMQKVHFLFGRFCFCPRNTVGYFKVKQGTLKIDLQGHLSFSFKNDRDLPQRIHEFSAAIDYVD